MFDTIVSNWSAGFGMIMNPSVVFLVIGGVSLGLLFGAIPGLTAVLAMVLLLPLTYGMAPAAGFALLVATYIGGITGGLVSAIMIGVPGTPASIVTTYDGHAMARRGEAGRALGLGFVASFFGGLLGWLMLVFLTPQLSRFALSIRSVEYTAIILFGFTIVTVSSSNDLKKASLMTVLGCLIAAVGMDPLHGTSRLTFGLGALRGGFGMVPVLSGMYVISRAIEEAEALHERYISPPSRISGVWAQIGGTLRDSVNLIRSSAIGIAIGILPGIGAAVAPFVSYNQAKKWSKNPEEFGTGAEQGIVASEACNNATIGGALIPALALGIPGDVPVVILLSGFVLQGFQPGPLFFAENLDLVYAIYVAFLLSNVAMLLIGMTVGVRFFTRVLSAPKMYLVPVILVGGMIGSYNVGYSMADVWVALGAGVFAHVARKSGYPLTPLVIAIILGPMFEYNLRVAMNLTHGSLLPFVQRPIALVFLVLTLATVVIAVWHSRSNQNQQHEAIND